MPDIAGDNSTNTVITVGSSVNDSIEVSGDHDWFRLTLTADQTVTISLNGAGSTPLPDPYLRIRDANGNVLYENDDGGPGLNSLLSFSAPYGGVYFIDVSAWEDTTGTQPLTGSYQLSVTNFVPPPSGTADQFADQLVSGYWEGDVRHWDVHAGGTLTVNITALTTEGQAAAREALATWSGLLGISFTEVDTGGQITFDDDQSGANTSGTWSNGLITSEHVNISTQWLSDYGSTVGTYGFQSYLHEIGHALGLGHSGDYNTTADFPYDAKYLNDSWAMSVMSYFDQSEARTNDSRAFLGTPMLADVIAISRLYGLSATTRAGDTTYGFNSSAGLAAYDARLHPDLAYTVFDSGGVDTLDYSGFSGHQRIDLTPGGSSDVGGLLGNVEIAPGTIIENAIGGSGNDDVIGNEANNVLYGGSGSDYVAGRGGDDTLIGGPSDDSLDGGDGVDTVSYADASAGVTVSIREQYAHSTPAGDAANIGTDRLYSIENILGSSFGDQLTGDFGANRIDGGAGNDALLGYEGNDVLIGGAGADTLTGGSGADLFVGSAADFNGDTITDFASDDQIIVTDADVSTFSMTLSGSGLLFMGTALSFSVAPGNLIFSASNSGGVTIRLASTVQPYLVAADDFNGDGRSDVLWRNNDGTVTDWLGAGHGTFLSNDSGLFRSVPANWHVVATGDFSGDGRTDILWRNDAGEVTDWLSTWGSFFNPSPTFQPNDQNLYRSVPTSWHVAGTGDFNGDGRVDVLWRNDDGTVTDWLANGSAGFESNDAAAFISVPLSWHVAGTGDFNGDGRADVLWRNVDGTVTDWLGTAAGGFVSNDAAAFVPVPASWQVVGTGDFNGDGRTDVLWRSDTGIVTDWLATSAGGFVGNDANLFIAVPSDWHVAAVGDYNADRRADVLWRNDGGTVTDWVATGNGGFIGNDGNLFQSVPTDWHIQSPSIA